MCKPWKRQGVDDPIRSELKARLDQEEQLLELQDLEQEELETQ